VSDASVVSGGTSRFPQAPLHWSRFRGQALRAATLRRPMAVPKKKTSKARRDKRRAQHKIESPRLNICPQCGQPKRPHRVCPTCHTYRGRDVEPLHTPAP
jgi:large subunit ribosomal protein L32